MERINSRYPHTPLVAVKSRARISGWNDLIVFDLVARDDTERPAQLEYGLANAVWRKLMRHGEKASETNLLL